ncbi:hypothetical protein JCM10213_002026 [Rhodosporidiobolus nylandii]
MLPSPARSPARKRTVLLLAFSSLLFHLWLASKLGGVRSILAATFGTDEANAGGGDDARDLEGAEWRRLAGVGTLLGIGKLWSYCSAGVAGMGVYGGYKDRLPLLRLFVLNAFLSLALDALLLFLAFLLLTLATPSSSSVEHSFATTLCQAISSSPSTASSFTQWLGLPDLLGLSLEACEDRFDGLLLSAVFSLAVVEGLRGWAAVKVLGYYYALSTRGGSGSGRNRRPDDLSLLPERRGYSDSPVELDFAASPSGTRSKRSHSFRRERSSSRTYPSSHSHSQGGQREHETRILLLPRPEDAPKQGEIPALTLTASSPVRTSFPPSVQGPGRQGSGTERERGKVLVYAPVYMTPEEARTCGAKELVLSGRPRSSTHSSSSSSTATAGGRSRSSTLVPSPPSASAVTLKLDTASGRSAQPPGPPRMDSDEMGTPVATRTQGMMEVLRGDAEEGGGDKGKLA